MRKVAFFDIDGTFFRSSLFIELVEQLIDEGKFPISARDEYNDEFHSWLNREGDYESYIDAMITTFFNHIKGVYYGDMADLGRLVVARHSRKIYLYTKNLLQQLKQEGYYTVAISQSPKVILDEFCQNYGFDKVYGRIYEIGPTDRFTGVVVDEHLIQNKANIVKRVFESNEFTKEGSFAIGDTEGDISMLELVENPICFNPNQTLYNEAKRLGWKIVVERKDMIYEL